MASITGLLIFNVNRSGLIDFANDSGVANIPIVLQSTDGDLRTIATFTDDSGEYKFSNVPPGNYRVVVAAVSYTHLPALYKNYILDKCSSLSPNNLISAGDNGTFGDVEIGSEPNSGPATNPYSNSSLMSDFTWIKQSNEIPIGDYTIGNTTKPYNESELYDWWRLSDHTTSIETGRMQIVGGNSSNKKALSTTVNNLEKNTTYLFTAWVASLNKNQSPSDSKVGVTVDGLDTHTPLYSNLNHMISTDPKLPIWQEIGVKFNTGENTSVSLNMLSVAPMYFFAIDDIKLRKVTNLCRTDVYKRQPL